MGSLWRFQGMGHWRWLYREVFCWTWLKHLDSRFGWKNTFLFTFKFWAKKQNSMAGSWMWLANFAIPVVRLQIWPCLLVKFVGKWSNGQNQTQSAVKDARRVLLAPKWWSCTNHLEGSWALMDLRSSLFFFQFAGNPLSSMIFPLKCRIWPIGLLSGAKGMATGSLLWSDWAELRA